MSTASCGQASCVGGLRLDPPLESFPLLVYSNGAVRTEDGAATIYTLACDFAAGTTIATIAREYSTTPAHVRQALAYAVLAGKLDI